MIAYSQGEENVIHDAPPWLITWKISSTGLCFFCASFHPVDKWKTILVDCYTLIIPVNNAEKQIRLTIENKENRQHVTLSETQTFTVRSAFNQTVINIEGQPK